MTSAKYIHVFAADDGEPLPDKQFDDSYDALEDLAERPYQWTSYRYTAVMMTTAGLTTLQMEDEARALAEQWRIERRGYYGMSLAG